MIMLWVLMVYSLAGSPQGDFTQGTLYPVRVTPHPGLGHFEPVRDPDEPILGFYGGIGLQADGEGGWSHYGVQSTEAVDKLISRCVDSGMDRIYANIMFQWTESKLMNQIPVELENEDVNLLFAYAIEQAHEHNIEFYLDIPVFGRRTRDEKFIAEHPNVFTRSVSGEVKEEYFSPANHVVRAYRIAIILEALSHYPVDGIQLDFIRWPGGGPDLIGSYSPWGYENAMLALFRQTYNLPDNFVPEPDDPRFIQARADVVTGFIKELHDTLADNGIDLPIGVYNSNSRGRAASLRHVCQDWHAWEVQSLVDEHHPMFYLDSKWRLMRAVGSIIDVKRSDSTVFGPVFLDGPGPKSHEHIVDISRRMIKAGCDGIWFCLATRLEEQDLWPTVKEVGELSIRQIRDSAFDPAYQNLVLNHYALATSEQKGWVCYENDHELTIDSEEPPVFGPHATKHKTYRQEIRHIGHPVVAPRSLAFSFRYMTSGREQSPKARVTLLLTYSDGHVSERAYPIPSTFSSVDGWQTVKDTFEVEFDHRSRCLKSTTIQLDLPPGQEGMLIDMFELLADPLHDPRQPQMAGEYN